MSTPRRRATIKDLAAAVGVAPSTVSNAYNRPDQLSAELRERILAVADTVGYGGPDPAARGLRTRRSGSVAVLLGGPLVNVVADPVTAATLSGIVDELDTAGLALTLVPTPAGSAVALPAADGLIALCGDEAGPLLALALRATAPLVLVDAVMMGGGMKEEGGRRRDEEAPSLLLPPASRQRVGVDDTVAARSAVGHLLALGHHRLAVLVDHVPRREDEGGRRREEGHGPPCLPPPSSSGRVCSRLQGYRIGIEAVGLAWADVPIVAAGADSEEAGRAAARAIMSGGEATTRPTAVLATSDQLALGALAAARDLGIAVPAALSVVGFDDTLTKPTSPALTTVRQPHRLKGRAAARALLALIRDEPPPASERLLPKLVVRGSSGPAPAEEEG